MEILGPGNKQEKNDLSPEPVTVTDVRGAGGEIQIHKTYPTRAVIPENKGVNTGELPQRDPKEMLKRLIKGLNGKH